MNTIQYLKLDAGSTIADAFQLRCRSTPQGAAYREFDAAQNKWIDYTWNEVAALVARFRQGLESEGLQAGDRIAIMLKNGVQWIVADQAAYALGLVPVPLFVDDRADNVAYIVNNAEIKFIVIDGNDHWQRLKPVAGELSTLKRILCLKPVEDAAEPRLASLTSWLPAAAGEYVRPQAQATDLATIVYTSGTTGKPKGVMLSHRNILSNAQSGLAIYRIYTEDVFLSFLPLSHSFERTFGYYLTLLSGASVAFNRSIPQLAEDFRIIKPTGVFSVPRIYERFYAAIQEQIQKAPPLKRKLFNLAVNVGWNRFEHQNGRGSWQISFLLWPLLKALVADKLLARFGGRLRVAISGGAALSIDVARVFLGLGLPVCQGYGMTESSPLLSVNLLEKNDPRTVGFAVPGVQLKLGENNVLLAKGPNIMLGYWRNPEATAVVLSADGWLNTGDQAKIDAEGWVTITGRIKEIIVLANGEKIPPVDMELAIQLDSLFEQALVLGEGKSYLSALVVLNDKLWTQLQAENSLTAEKAEKFLVQRIAGLIKSFPGYAQIRRVAISPDKWSIENGMLTSTLKPKRAVILDKYVALVDDLYKGRA